MFQRVLLPLSVHNECIAIRSMWEGTIDGAAWGDRTPRHTFHVGRDHRTLNELIESKRPGGWGVVGGWCFIVWLSVVAHLCVFCVRVFLGWGWALLGVRGLSCLFGWSVVFDDGAISSALSVPVL